MTTRQIGLATRHLSALIALAVAARLATIFVLGTWRGGPATAGAYEHDVIARHLVAGDGFAYAFYTGVPEATATQAPMLPWLVSTAYAGLGVASPASMLALQCFAALLAAPAMLGLAWLTRWLGTARAARGDAMRPSDVAAWQTFALLGFALAPAFVYMTTRVQTINWSVSLLLLVLGLFARFAERRTPSRAVAAGAGVALACLGEPILALPLGLAWCALVLATRPGPAHVGDGRAMRSRRTAWLIPAVAALCVLPWIVRNTVVLGEPTFIKSSFWYVFWQGNHIGASGTDKLAVDPDTADRLRWRVGGAGLESSLEAARRQAVSVDTHLSDRELAELHQMPGESARMAWFGDRVRGELAARPGHYLRMFGRRLRIIAWFDPTNPRSFALPYRAPYVGLAILACAGGALWGRPRGPDGVVLAAFVGIVLALAGIITSARFRLLLEAVMLLPAAWAVAWLLRRAGSRGVAGRGARPLGPRDAPPPARGEA